MAHKDVFLRVEQVEKQMIKQDQKNRGAFQLPE